MNFGSILLRCTKSKIKFRAADDSNCFVKNGDSLGRMFSHNPVIAKMFPNLSDYNQIRQAAGAQYEFMKGFIDEQYRTYDDNHERHFLDVYFKEMKATQRNKNFRNADFNCKRNVQHSPLAQ